MLLPRSCPGAGDLQSILAPPAGLSGPHACSGRRGEGPAVAGQAAALVLEACHASKPTVHKRLPRSAISFARLRSQHIELEVPEAAIDHRGCRLYILSLARASAHPMTSRQKRCGACSRSGCDLPPPASTVALEAGGPSPD